MKGKGIITLYLFILITELIALVLLFQAIRDPKADAVSINEILWEVKHDWNSFDQHQNDSTLSYAVIDNNEKTLYQSDASVSTNINEALLHQDTILDIEIDREIKGKLIISNQLTPLYQSRLQMIFITIIVMIIIQAVIAVIYFLYLQRTIIFPFVKLHSFAKQVAYGNLDIPLTMDRKNVFGAFSEAFDLMRSEIKQARIAEAAANDSKKELIAKLSHDIKTPLASIKAASEVGAAISKNDSDKANYAQIMQKSDQINTLVSDLFTASLEELKELSVHTSVCAADEIITLLANADYKHQATVSEIPDCKISADLLRLQQVFDNIFANAYKYAKPPILVTSTLSDRYLMIAIEDHGNGISERELLHIKEKYARGSNSVGLEGAGLGLYIADYLMKMMQGALTVENGTHGFAVKVYLAVTESSLSAALSSI